MKHLSPITQRLPKTAQLKGDSIFKDCTPLKENFGKCEDDAS
jgi:hypothetical protein